MLDTIKKILKSGIDVDDTDKYGWSALVESKNECKIKGLASMDKKYQLLCMVNHNISAIKSTCLVTITHFQ